VCSEKEPVAIQFILEQQIFVVELNSEQDSKQKQVIVHSRHQFRFFGDENSEEKYNPDLDQFLGFTDNYLIVANANTVKYVYIPQKEFNPLDMGTPCDTTPYNLGQNTQV
jgi:hypothetical protein